jgi:23S rRNA pseudouridine2605 synthase
MALERLQKVLAACGLASRRRADAIIRQGRVAVDGQIIQVLGHKVDPQTAVITVDGKPIKPSESLKYYLFHKPEGFLTTLFDPQNRPTIRSFLEKLPVRVYPVGRLDKDVSGLLLLTNDGELAKRLMHPSYMIPKVYRAKVKGIPDKTDLELLSSGRLIIDSKPIVPAKAYLLDSGKDKGWLELTLTEGRHHQVKRMCAASGHPVIQLKRVSYCGLKIPKGLEPGQILELTEPMVKMLLCKVGLKPKNSETSG